MTAFLTMLFLLVAVHAVADFPLQGDYMAKEKANSFYILFMHALIHALGVYLITRSMLFALIELVAHATIDKLKTDGRISFGVDQALHIGCKVVYALIATGVIAL